MLRALAVLSLAPCLVAFNVPRVTPARRVSLRAASADEPAAVGAPQTASFTQALWGVESLPAVGGDDGRVLVTVYEIGGGLTKLLSTTCSKTLPMIPHVGVRLYGNEYFYSDHIESRPTAVMQQMLPATEFPQVTLDLGPPTVSEAELEEWLAGNINDAWQPESYDVFNHNCNHFAVEMAQVVARGREGVAEGGAACDGLEPALARPVLAVTEEMLSELPEWRRALGNHLMTQVTRFVVTAWGRATKEKKEQLASDLGVDAGN